jgi:hypothetical protein
MSWKGDRISEGSSGYGLVVGRIQSGKTAHIIGLSLLAMDKTINGFDKAYDTVIILSGLLEDLRKQTFGRVSDLGISGISVFPRKADFSESNEDAKEELLQALYSVDPCILVVKKNHQVLEAIIEYLAEDEIAMQIDERRVLIIDDECDHASIDSGHSEGDPAAQRITATNRAVRGLIRILLPSKGTQWYLGYTATPYSNLLMDPDPDFLDHGLGPSLFPRDTIHLLPRPARDGIPEKGHHYDNQDFFSADGAPYIREQDTPPPGSGDERNHLREILLMHVISKILREKNGLVKEHTTMVHTDTSTDEHLRIGNIIGEIKEKEYHEISDKQAIDEILVCAGKHYSQHLEYLEQECSRISQSSFQSLSGMFMEIDIILLNSDTEQDGADYEFPSQLHYDSDDEVSIIVIGGHKLARGLTLEGLTVSWFARTANRPNYDSLLQMARWCGYRGEYHDLIRIFMDTDTIEHYRFITEVERRLRVDLKQFTRDTNPLEEVQWIREYHGMSISGKLPWNLTQHPSSTKSLDPEMVLEQLPENFTKKGDKETQEEILEALQELLFFHDGDFKKGKEEFEVAHTSYEMVDDFVRIYSESFQKKCESKEYLKRLLLEISESDELSGDWNLVVYNPSGGTEYPDLPFRLSRMGLKKGDSNLIKVPEQTGSSDLPPGSTTREKPMLCIFLEDPGQSFAGIPVYKDNGIPIVIIGFYLPLDSLSPAFIEMARPGVEV